MPDMNFGVLSGTISKAGQYRELNNGTPLCDIEIANCWHTDREPDLAPLTLWREDAKLAATLPAGTRVIVHYKLSSREYNGNIYPQIRVHGFAVLPSAAGPQAARDSAPAPFPEPDDEARPLDMHDETMDPLPF